MSHDEADAATAYDADKTGNHERVIQNVFADTRRARTVEAYERQVGRISRQEKVTVARADKRHDDNGIHADAQRHGEDDSDCRRLTVDELGREERDNRERPRIFRDGVAEELFKERHVRAEAGICHPRDAVNRDQRDDTRFKNLAVADVLSLDFADENITIWITAVIEIGFKSPFALGKCGNRSGKLPSAAITRMPAKKMYIA